jgi:hypothetical protein
LYRVVAISGILSGGNGIGAISLRGRRPDQGVQTFNAVPKNFVDVAYIGSRGEHI